MPDRERSCSGAWTGTRWPLSGSIWTPCAPGIESSFGPEALTQAARRQPRPSGLKGGPSTLVLLQRAHPDIFEDALWAVISKAKERTS